MEKILLVVTVLIFGLVGSASANLIENGDFNDGFADWTTNGDVRIADADTNDIGGLLASAQGMVGKYALLGLGTSEGTSTLQQDFAITGINEVTISFNWAFDYWDFSFTADDTFLALVRDVGEDPVMSISLLDLTSGNNTSNIGLDFAYGYYSETIDISDFSSGDSRVVFSLIEERSGGCWDGTLSIAGIDNVEVTGTAPVPEPGTMLLMGLGIAGFVGCNRKRFIKESMING
jgi:hypothetical protein